MEYIGTGEIVVACRYLAPGYWKDAEKTEQRFSHDPELGRLYWTGDLGGRLGGAKIEILGRLDSQVKLRGFRIELGEIESRLIRHPRIKEAVVLVKEYDAGGKYLTAYIVSLPPPTASTNKTSETSLTNELRQYLSLRLPDYMIPNIFVEIERMPLTPTGKIDRQALPVPRLKEETTGPAPLTGEVERQLAEIWSAVLNVPPAAVGRQANFFELGGHSLKALTVMGRVHRQLNVRLDIEDIFSFPLLYSLARKIRNSRQAAFSPIRATEKREYYPLSSAQKRLYFIQQLEPGATGYNMTHMRIFEGSMDRPALARILKTLICRHQSLRTSFHLMEGEPVQRIHDDVDFEIEYYDAGLIDNFMRPFDLSRSPLLRVGLCQLEEQRYTIMADIHHIAADGSSLQIFNRELQRLYRGESLPPLRLQYRDFSQWQNRQRESETYRAQAAYWQGIFAGEIPVLQLACDHPRPPVQGHRGRRIRFGLDRQQTEALKDLALSQEVTLFVLLSGCLRVLLFRLSGQQDVVIGTPVAGRRHSDLDGIMGMVVNTLALRHFLLPPQPFSQFLTALKEETLTAFGNQDYQFEDLVGSVEVSRDMGRNPLFDVMLVLHNQAELADFEPEFEAPDISSRLDSGPISTNFDLILHGVEAGGRLSFSLEYCTDLFKEETIRRWIGYFERIIAAVLRDPERVPGDIEIVDTAEKEALLALCSGPVEKSLPAPTISAWFDRQAAAHPGQIALIGTAGCHRWSYGELRRQIGRLAGVLRAKGIGAGQVGGGQLVLVSEETRQNLTDLFRVVTVQGVKTLFLPAVLVKFIGRQLHYLQQIPAVLDHIVAAGEQLVVSEELARFLVARHICLHNHYGPAEAHVVTAHRLEPHRLEEGSPPIGKPVMNTAVYITGPNRQLQPLGVRGELFIAGRQVGRGYLNNPELTAEKFVNLAAKAREDTRSSTPRTLSPNPYILNPKSQILYRTGDLARFLPDGTIEFLGRIDHQVKIRGYRVEPTEVEAVIYRSSAGNCPNCCPTIWCLPILWNWSRFPCR